jgi:3-oxoacyl-[acyl-carrier-protein] synthase-3
MIQPQGAALAGVEAGLEKSSGLGVCVRGLGHYLPLDKITNDDLSRMVDTSDEWILPRTGIRSRHVAAKEEATSDLAAAAGARALADAGFEPSEIDLLIVATATPDAPVPSAACLVQKKLGITQTASMDISAACAGFVFATHTAAGLIKAGMHKRALVIGAETLTRITDYTDRQSCILFGDGAGAFVLTASGDNPAYADDVAGHGAGRMAHRGLELIYSRIGTDAKHSDLIRVIAGGSRRPASAETVRDHEHYLTLKGAEVFRRAVEAMGRAGKEALASLGMTIADIRWVVPHQANLRIMNAVADALGATSRQLVEDIATVGNTSAASLPLALSRLGERGEPSTGDRIMLLTFGAGTTWGCQVYEQG